MRHFSSAVLIFIIVSIVSGCSQNQKPIEVMAPSQSTDKEKKSVLTPKPPITLHKNLEKNPFIQLPIQKTPSEILKRPLLDQIDTQTKEYFQIALLLPLSGSSANIGQSILRGIEMALYRYGSDRLVLKIYDTQGRRLPTVQKTRIAIKEGADFILGPVFAHTSKAAMALAAQAKIPVFSFSNNRQTFLSINSQNPIEKQQSRYILGLTPKNQLEQLLDAAILSKKSRFALIAPNDEYGRLIRDHILNLLSSRTGNLERYSLYDPEKIDYAQPIKDISDYQKRRQAYQNEKKALEESGITNLKEIQKKLHFKETFGPLPFDALIIITYDDNSLRTLAAQLEFYDIDPEETQFLGLKQWQDFPDLQREPSLRGAWFIGQNPVAFKQFNDEYSNIYPIDKTPKADIFTTMGFDSLAFISYMERQGAQGKATNEIIQSKEGFFGAMGTQRFESDGTLNRLLSVFEITPQGITQRFPAPKNWDLPKIKLNPPILSVQ